MWSLNCECPQSEKNHNKASKSHPSSTQCHRVNVPISKVKNKRIAGKRGLKQGWSPVGKAPNLTAPCPGLVTASSFHLCCGNCDLLLQLAPLSACDSPWWTSHILAPLISWGLPRHWSLTFMASDRACVGALCQESKPDLRHISHLYQLSGTRTQPSASPHAFRTNST